MTKDKQLFETILCFAQSENKLLAENFRKGIFDMPELAFAYEIGKRVARDTEKYLGSKGYDWVREYVFDNGGPTDLAFLATDQTLPNCAIEFKMDDTVQKYAADVTKLAYLGLGSDRPTQWEKYFCSLKWVLHEEQGYGFLNSMKLAFGDSASLVQRGGFPCLVGKQAKEHYCLVTLWKCR